jgi:hypothetical protein
VVAAARLLQLLHERAPLLLEVVAVVAAAVAVVVLLLRLPAAAAWQRPLCLARSGLLAAATPVTVCVPVAQVKLPCRCLHTAVGRAFPAATDRRALAAGLATTGCRCRFPTVPSA